MRKMICLSVALAMLLCSIAGCVPNDSPRGESTGSNISTDSTNGEIVGSDAPTHSTNGLTDPSSSAQPTTPVLVIPPTAPKDPGNTLVPFDPDRDIYLLYENQNVKIQKGFTSMPSIGVYILSKNELDINVISMELPAQTDYVVSVGEIELGGIASVGETGPAIRDKFSYALYQSYMGKDFAMMWELESEYLAAYEAYSKEKIGYEEYDAARQAYISYRDEEKGSYLQLTKGDLPDFHVYYASVMFYGGEFYEETITTAQLRIADQTHTLTLGEIILRKQEPNFPAALDWYNGGGYAYDGILGSGNAPLLYNDGIHRIQSYFSFTTEHAMVLTDLQLDNPNHELVAVWLEVASNAGGGINELWDMSEPFLLMPGDRVKIHIAYRDKTMTSLSYATKVWGYLIYEWDEGVSCKMSECDVRAAGDTNFYELYALVFDGLDLESYYRDYYYPKYEPWRYELDESLDG